MNGLWFRFVGIFLPGPKALKCNDDWHTAPIFYAVEEICITRTAFRNS